MDWKIILITFGFMVLGYLVGSVINSIWVTKVFGLKDVRLAGSKNAGATNVARVHGKKIATIVLILDLLKPIFVMTLAKLAIGADKVVVQAAGIATVIGHIFPIFYKFKGGKGAACIFGFIFIMNWTLFFISAPIFSLIAYKAKKIGAGSLLTPLIITIIYISLSQIKNYNSEIFEPLTFTYSYWINVISVLIMVVFVTYAHRQNIEMLLSKPKDAKYEG